jgi:hypothetical protein
MTRRRAVYNALDRKYQGLSCGDHDEDRSREVGRLAFVTGRRLPKGKGKQALDLG